MLEEGVYAVEDDQSGYVCTNISKWDLFLTPLLAPAAGGSSTEVSQNRSENGAKLNK